MKIKLITAVCMMVSILVSKDALAQVPHVSLYAHGLYATALDKSSQNFSVFWIISVAASHMPLHWCGQG